MSEGFTNTASTPVTPKVLKPSRKDRAKRALINLATKHHFHQDHAARNALPAAITEKSWKAVGGGGVKGGDAAAVSPLVTATDAATVRPGMLLKSVVAHGGQGVSEEPVDTFGMGVKEAIETLVR